MMGFHQLHKDGNVSVEPDFIGVTVPQTIARFWQGFQDLLWDANTVGNPEISMPRETNNRY